MGGGGSSLIRHCIQEIQPGELPVALLEKEEELREECVMGLKIKRTS